MRFQPVNCNIMQITRKRIKKIKASYSIEGTVLENVEKIEYLGVTITNDLKWNTHVSNICTKARTGSMTGILEQLKWESLKKRRKDSRLIMLYKGLKGAASIPTNDLVPPIRRTKNHHSLAFQIPMAGTDICKSSFFPQTIRDWNSLTDSLISASERAVDSVTKFTSLVRARN